MRRWLSVSWHSSWHAVIQWINVGVPLLQAERGEKGNMLNEMCSTDKVQCQEQF